MAIALLGCLAASGSILGLGNGIESREELFGSTPKSSLMILDVVFLTHGFNLRLNLTKVMSR